MSAPLAMQRPFSARRTAQEPKRDRLAVSSWPRSTPLGRSAGLLAIGLLFAGFNTGNNLFYLVFAVLAASELIGFIAAGYALRRARTHVRLAPRGVVGRPLTVTVTIENRGRTTSIPALRWTAPAADGELDLVTPPAPPGATVVARGRFIPGSRGRLALGRLMARTDYPLGLARRVVRMRPPRGTALIAPAELPGRARHRPRRAQAALRARVSRRRGEEPHEARAYRPGDDARRIDWKATARSVEVMWRERRGEPSAMLEVRLDRGGPPGERFERRVARAAGAALEALRSGRAVRFTTDEIRLELASEQEKGELLDYLALVAPRGGEGG